MTAQAAALGRLRVIDRQALEIGSLPAARVVLQRRDDSAEVVVLDEWRIAQRGRGWTISAFCPVASYWALSRLLEASALSFVPPEAAEPAAGRPGYDAGA